MGRALADSELFARLVGFDSTSRNSNLPLADFLAGYLERPGVRIDRNLSPDGTKTNLIAWAGPPPDSPGPRRGLVLSGHMDVVPADEEGWRSDPFTLTDLGDRFVGRGSADMKGFLALAANLFLETDRLAAPLVLVFTYDEEVGTLGARHLYESYAEGRVLPENAIIGEPTSLRVARLHKGHVKLRITLKGVSAHSGYPHLGVNAIEPAGRVVEALSRLRQALESEEAPYRELFPEVPYVPLNVGTIHGGSAINVVPDRCTVEVGVRPLPGMGSEELALRVRQAAREAAAPLAPLALLALEFEMLSDSPPLLLDAEAPILRHLAGLTGMEGGSVSFATDAGWLSRLGIDCAIWGPGSIEVAHKPNEHIPKADLAAARGMLETTIHRFCREGV
jgi:acetylornithine deacetylase